MAASSMESLTEMRKHGRGVSPLILALARHPPKHPNALIRAGIAYFRCDNRQDQERMIKAMVNKPERAVVLDQPDQIRFAQLCARKHALGLELKGLRRSRGQSAYAICKQVYHLKGSRQKVYEQMCELVEKMKRGELEFTEPLP